ncbi:MAG: YlxM family DNA-binding protein [Oscillospiraceae bacterium]|nr:YlxM family DNA-binding protein [Oscillospiraceae bacterium]
MFEKNYKISYLLDFYGNILTDKQRDAIDLYYNEDLSLAEISEHFGITRQGVRDNIKRGEDTLLDMEDKLGFAGKFEEHRKAFEEISECAQTIRYSKSNLNFVKIIEENMSVIVDRIASVTSKEEG